MMAAPLFEIYFRPSVDKDLQSIPPAQNRKILLSIEILKTNPTPPGSAKLSGAPWHRLRCGKYRIIYYKSKNRPVIEIVKIGHRKDVYRMLKPRD